jgi:hypothetical protein
VPQKSLDVKSSSRVISIYGFSPLMSSLLFTGSAILFMLVYGVVLSTLGLVNKPLVSIDASKHNAFCGFAKKKLFGTWPANV